MIKVKQQDTEELFLKSQKLRNSETQKKFELWLLNFFSNGVKEPH